MDHLSIEEAIKSLKAEIIAQDWRISPKRTEIIEGALGCLQEHFQERKATHAMLIMAQSVLEYIRKKGSNPSETVDFLKEAMAHVVSQYEDIEYDQKREEEIFRSLFGHFSKLKKLIKTGKKPGHKQPTPTPSKPSLPPGGIFENPPASTPSSTLQKPSRTNLLESLEAEKLISDLRNSLEKAGQVGSTIGELLEQLIESQHSKEGSWINSSVAGPCAQVPTPISQATEQKTPAQEIREQGSTSKPSDGGIKSCPPTELRELSIGRTKLAIQESHIAAIKPLKAAKIEKYLKKSHVPAKEFSSFLHNLPGQFKGPLGKLKKSKLRKLDLPILVPRGLDLPEGPDPHAKNMLVLSNGSWHGIIVCETIEQQPKSMVKFQKKQNGDIAGIGYMEDKEEILLLDTLAILRREGFLIIAS